MLALGHFGAHGSAYHPPSADARRRQVSRAGGIDSGAPFLGVSIEGVTMQPGRLMADANGLQLHRRDDAPVFGIADRRG